MKFLVEYMKSNNTKNKLLEVFGKEDYNNLIITKKDNIIEVIVYDKYKQTEMNLMKKYYLDKLKELFNEDLDMVIKIGKAVKRIKKETEKKEEIDIKGSILKNEKKYENLENENIKSLYILRDTYNDIRNQKEKGSRKCKICDNAVFDKNKDICILCYNKKIFNEKEKIKAKIYKEKIYTLEYATKIDGFLKASYDMARDEVLSYLFSKFFEKYTKKQRFEEEIIEYIKVFYETENKDIIMMKKESILNSIKKMEEKNENIKRRNN